MTVKDLVIELLKQPLSAEVFVFSPNDEVSTNLDVALQDGYEHGTPGTHRIHVLIDGRP